MHWKMSSAKRCLFNLSLNELNSTSTSITMSRAPLFYNEATPGIIGETELAYYL